MKTSDSREAAVAAENERLRQELEALRIKLADAEALADRDPLLPVLNRRAFVRELSRVIAFGRRYNEAAGLVYFDIDNFKQVNDTYGHSVGDEVLLHLAQAIVDNVRETDVVGRLGGDEFGIILARADEKTVEMKARLLAELIAQAPFTANGVEISLSISVGAISFSGEEEPQVALARADKAMYQDKHR